MATKTKTKAVKKTATKKAVKKTATKKVVKKTATKKVAKKTALVIRKRSCEFDSHLGHYVKVAYLLSVN